MRTGILDNEISSIVNAGYKYNLESTHKVKELHTPNYNIVPMNTLSVDVHRNYNSNLSDVVTVIMILPKGDYLKHVFPFKNELTITLISDNINGRVPEKYKFVINQTAIDIEVETNDDKTLSELNEDGLVKLSGQCISQTIEKIRLTHTFGIFTKTTVEAVVNSLISKTIGKYSDAGGMLQRKIKMVPADNKREYTHIQIPEGTSILAIPSFLQDTNYGIYNGNIGTYIQRYKDEEVVYVYPLHKANSNDYDRNLMLFDTSLAELNIYECTYVLDKKQLKIVATRMIDERPIDETSIKESGTGIQGIESDTIMNRSATITKDKITINSNEYSRVMNHRELKDSSKEIRSIGISNNFYKHRSKILANDGNLIAFKWLRSNADLLIPGMFVTYIREEKGKIVKYSGVLHAVTKMTDNDSKTETSILMIFIGNS